MVINPPKIPPPLGTSTSARAYRTAALTLTGTWAKVALDTVAYDPGANVSLVNNRYVCPATGYYQVQGQLLGTQSVAGEVLAAIYKNGVRVSTSAPGGATAAGLDGGANVADLVQCNASDYLELWSLIGAGNLALNVTTPSLNYLSSVQVG
jgi:hypothetical protein